MTGLGLHEGTKGRGFVLGSSWLKIEQAQIWARKV